MQKSAFNEFMASMAAGRATRRVMRILNQTGTNTVPVIDSVNDELELYPEEMTDSRQWVRKGNQLINRGLSPLRPVYRHIPGMGQPVRRPLPPPPPNRRRGLQKSGSVYTDQWGVSGSPRGFGPNVSKPMAESLYARDTLDNEKGKLLAREQARTDIAANRKAVAQGASGLQTPANMQNVLNPYTTYAMSGLTGMGSL